MPRSKSTINLTPAQMLSKIKKSAKESAYRGYSCLSKEELKRKRGYTDEQIEVYFTVFAANKLSDEEQKLKKARRDAQLSASQGRACATVSALEAKGYNATQIETYLASYEASKGSDEEQAIKKVRHAAHTLACQGSACPTMESLKAKGYSAAQIKAYRAAYEASKGTDNEQAIKKARHDAHKLADCGYACPTVEALKAKGYNDAQIEAYRIAHEESKGSNDEQALRKARHYAQALASSGSAYPTIEALKAKGFSDAQIEAYRIAYEAAKGSDEEQAIRKARYDAQILANKGCACPTAENLKAKGFSDVQIKAYRIAYEASKGTDEEQALRKARHYAQALASHGSTCPTIAELKVKGYSDAQIEAYRIAYEVAKGTDEEQAIRHARYNAQALARQGYACPTPEILKAKGYGDEQIQAYQAAHKAFEDTHEMPARSTLEHRDFNHDEEIEFMSDDDSDEEAALLLFFSIQRSNTTSTSMTNTALIDQDTSAKTRRLT